MAKTVKVQNRSDEYQYVSGYARFAPGEERVVDPIQADELIANPNFVIVKQTESKQTEVKKKNDK